MIVFKLCIYILLSTLFKMKKIEIEINYQDNFEIYSNLKLFLLNTRLFLIFFTIDIMAQLALVYVLYLLFTAQDCTEISTSMQAILWTFAIAYFIWFIFYIYLVLYFYRMGENLCKCTLEYGPRDMLRTRIISLFIGCIIIIGSAHFFLLNGIEFILIAKQIPYPRQRSYEEL